MFVTYSQVMAGTVKYGLAIGADTSQGAPGDALEISASAGAAAYIMGAENLVAEITHTYSFMHDTPDFWRREHENYPQHAARYTGEPAYFRHVVGCGERLLETSGEKPENIQWFVAHQPNGKFPLRAGKMLGFPREKIEQGWLINLLGNTYSGSSPLGLTAVLDVAKPGDRIMMVSYGSGAGSDGFLLTVKDRITEVQNITEQTRPMLETGRIYLDYGTYVKFRGKIIRNH
jgi:hydroxymethylglutaryl-CoA synthase